MPRRTTQYRIQPRLGRWAPLAVAVVGSAVLAPPAGAAVAKISDIIEVSTNTSEVLIGGVDGAAVNLERNGVVIATGAAGAAGAPVGTGEAGLNSDHFPGGCWNNGFVPQILPGDVVRNTTNGDFVTVGDVTVSGPITEENGAVVFRGTVGGPLPAGHGLEATIDPATEGFRWANVGMSGGQFLATGDGGGGVLTEHGDGTWTARFAGLTGTEKAQALNGEAGASVGMEHDIGPTGGEVTAFHFGGTPGGHGGCTEPYAPNEITGFDRAAINSANAASPVVVSGKSQPGVTSVQVTLTGTGGAPVVQTATPAGGNWTASLPAGSFADGPVNAAIRMTMAGGQFAGVGKAIAKDTVAPGAPTANVAAGTYKQVVNVALNGEDVHYTTDGSTPTAASPAYSSPVRVDKSQTIKAVSIDAAGNPSSVAQFAYTIELPVVTAAPVVGSAAPVAGPAESPATTITAPSLRVASLTVARRMTLRAARRSGVRTTVAAANGASVRVRLRRGNKTITSVLRRVGADGVLRVVLPASAKQRRALKRGTYRVQITSGGVTSTQSITLS